MENIGSVLTEGTMRAAVEIMASPGRMEPDVRRIKAHGEKGLELLVGCLRQTLRSNLRSGYYQKEWKDALDANMGEAMLKQIVNAQCVQAAIESIKIVAEEL